VFEGGEVLKVKYGRNPEIHTEVAATVCSVCRARGGLDLPVNGSAALLPEDPQVMLRCISSPFENGSALQAHLREKAHRCPPGRVTPADTWTSPPSPSSASGRARR
jgi:hypothetical protein